MPIVVTTISSTAVRLSTAKLKSTWKEPAGIHVPSVKCRPVSPNVPWKSVW